MSSKPHTCACLLTVCDERDFDSIPWAIQDPNTELLHVLILYFEDATYGAKRSSSLLNALLQSHQSAQGGTNQQDEWMNWPSACPPPLLRNRARISMPDLTPIPRVPLPGALPAWNYIIFSWLQCCRTTSPRVGLTQRWYMPMTLAFPPQHLPLLPTNGDRAQNFAPPPYFDPLLPELTTMISLLQCCRATSPRPSSAPGWRPRRGCP